MTEISHFCIKPLVIYRLECTDHAVRPTWGYPPPSIQFQKSEDAAFSSLGVMFLFFSKTLPIISHAITPSFGS